MLDLVAGLGRAAQHPEDEAAERVVVLDRQRDAELLVEVVDRERAVDAHAAVLEPLDRLVRQVELVLDLADDLLEQVLERDDPLELAVLVDHDRHVLVRAAELGQQRGQVLRLRDDVRRPQQLLELDAGDAAVDERREEVAHVQDADDLVERVAVDRVARVRRLDHRRQRLLGRQVDRERDHLGPRHHHGRDLLVGEVEDLVEHLLLLLLELALLGRAREQHLQLGLRVDLHLAAGRLQPERAQDRLARALQHPDQRLEDDEEAAHRRRDGERHPLRVAEREPLRHQLADDHVQEGDDQEREREGDHRRDTSGSKTRASTCSPSAPIARLVAGHAELHRRDEARRVRRRSAARPARGGCPSGPAPGSACGVP